MNADFMSAAQLRRWAAQCDTQLRDPLTCGDDFERLRTMRDSLLAVAQNQEWLEGQRLDKKNLAPVD